DIMPGKGHGLGILLLGPPGTGKTLTAESVAEHFQRPLLSFTPAALSIAELSLRDVFHLGHRWRAVLLLDEADPFIRKRTGSSDDDRVANLLKEFESFRGVLFLTTNSTAHNIDDALLNRILQVIKYEKPTRQDRKQMWTLYI
ncbi:P-loop containing nucleoside triphosphate hydrolase protein, partial [Phaeosphaeriaceae sp. PMI808]